MMRHILLALALAGPSRGWAQQIVGVSVGRQAPVVQAVPVGLGAPALEPKFERGAVGGLLSGAIPGLTPAAVRLSGPEAAAPGVEYAAPTPKTADTVRIGRDASAATPALPAGGNAALPKLDALLPSETPAPRPQADAGPARNEGRDTLERLAQDIPFDEPEESDVQGQKEFGARSFEFKRGGESQGRGAAIGGNHVDSARLKGSEPETPAAASDDGGGPNYPRRTVRFNKREFPSVAFRPNVSIEEELVKAIKASQHSIKIAVYEFKNRAVMEALQRAKRRGVKIEILVDYSNVFPKNEPDAEWRARRSNEIWGLIRDGFDFRVLRGLTAYGINHNKFAVFDGRLAEYGSYNWSFTAENAHYENAQFTTEKGRVAALGQYWRYLWDLSVPFAQAREHAWPQSPAKPPPASMPLVDFNGVKLPAMVLMPDGTVFEDAVAAAIDAAKKSVDVAMFALRSRRIADALGRAAARGVKVRMVMDESQSGSEYFGPFVAWLASQGIAVKTLAGPNPESDFPMAEKTHHKFMILDGKLVETGSANWTKRASMDNYENAHFLDDPVDAAAYGFAFEHMFKIAAAYQNPGKTVPALPTDEELLKDILNPPPPKPAPPAPDLPELPNRPTVGFNGVELPAYALLPEQPIAPVIIKVIDAARKSVRLALYEFTSESILEALRRARARGVKIELVLDRAHVYTSGLNHEGEPRKPKPQVVALAKEGFDLKILRGQRSGVMHNKFLVADDALAAFGSYNLTDVAESHHFENFVFTPDARRVEYYLKYYAYMRGLAEDVDLAKLDEILARTVESMAAAKEEGGTASHARRPPIPAPPEDPEKPVTLNGETFQRQLFSPNGIIEAALIRAIKAARVSIQIAMFSFYSQAIAEALLEVKQARPDLKIQIVMDHSQSKLAKLDDWFAYHGFDTRLIVGPHGDEGDPMFEKMHNKMMIIDGRLLETGSFNYSPNAQNNSFENANFFDDAPILAGYVAYFQRLWLQGWKPAPPKRRVAKPLSWKDSWRAPGTTAS